MAASSVCGEIALGPDPHADALRRAFLFRFKFAQDFARMSALRLQGTDQRQIKFFLARKK